MSSLGIPGDLPRATLLAKNLAPWQPDIDPRRSDQPQVISGRNWRDRIDGPCSDWSNAFANFNLFDTNSRQKVQELKLLTGSLYGTPTGVYKINPVSGVLELLLGPPQLTLVNGQLPNPFWPWTIAYVGDLFYLAQYDIGLWQYDPVNETLGYVPTPSGSKIRYICENHGRLIYFDDAVVAVSALDDGTDFTPDLATGAQAQDLGLVGGVPYRIEGLDDGFLVYLSKGIIKANYTTQAYAYTFGPALSKSIKVFSPNAGCYIDGMGSLVVDSNGMWLTREYNYSDYGKPQYWQPEKSDYIKQNIINNLNLNLPGTIFLYFSQALQGVFICFSSNLLQGYFQTTFFFDKVSGRFSTFDRPHYGIFEIYDPAVNNWTCGFMDQSGYMKEFTSTDFSEDLPDPPLALSDFTYRPGQTDELVIAIIDPNLNGGSPFEQVNTSINGSDANPFEYHLYSGFGAYQINDEVYFTENFPPGDPPMDVSGVPLIAQTNIDIFESGIIELFAVPYIIPEVGLDSNVVVGPWRFNDQKAFAEETSALESVMVGTQSVQGFTINEDWNLLTINEDWNTLNGADDWSAGYASPNEYILTLISSEDSFSIPIQGYEYLPVYQDFFSSKLYKPQGFASIYHALVFEADDVGQAFSLKTLDITAKFTGVYQAG